MSETETTETVETTPPAEESESKGIKALREANDRKDEKIAKLETEARTRSFNDLKIDTSEGLGKKLYELYDGDPDEASVAAFAEEFGWQRPATEEAATKSAKVEAADQALDRVAEVAEPADPAGVQEEIAAAEAAGDWVKSVTLKTQLHRQAQE